MTLRQIASVTKINVSALEALEANDPSKLPGGIFSRAFVRAYAQEVGLDADATVRQFLETFAQDVEPLKAVIVPPEIREPAPRLLAPAIAVVVLVGAAALGFRFIGWPGDRSAGEATATPSAAATAPLPVAPPAPTPAPPESLQPTSSPDAGPAAEIEVAANDLRDATRPAGAAPVTLDAAPVPVTVPVRDDGLMRISFRPQGGPCWVQVVADGKVELSRMIGAGEIETRAARDAFDVKVGDAGRCAYTLNDRPGRPLGPAGKVVRVRIDRQTLATFFQGS